jgi:hypothetical protein
MVSNGTNMYAKFHHNPRLQGSKGALVSQGMTVLQHYT